MMFSVPFCLFSLYPGILRSLRSGNTTDICDILRPRRDNSTCITFLKKEILTGEL